MRKITLSLWASGMLALTACDNNSTSPSGEVADSAPIQYTEQRAACADNNPNRNAYFGDLHVHTGYSMDAVAEGVRTTPWDSYAYAKGEEIDLPPYDEAGNTSSRTKIDRPLDFMAVTDHAEFMGANSICTDPNAPGYNVDTCVSFRRGSIMATMAFTNNVTTRTPTRPVDICGEDGSACLEAQAPVWAKIQQAAEDHYDRSEDCSFTTFVGYEYTGLPGGSNYHRNVIFRNADVPAAPISYVEAPFDYQLWDGLQKKCFDGVEGCDVLSIPHNSNLSNGKLLGTFYPEGRDQAAIATQRQIVEPLVEIFQHKANSECIREFPGLIGAPDEFCDFEQPRRIGDVRSIPAQTLPNGIDVPATTYPPAADCGDETGQAGMANAGCISRNDLVRGALLTGLQEEQRLGVNPLKFGFIGSTDTHLAIGGGTDEKSWPGHLGYETSLQGRLSGGFMPSNLLGNPGGLAGVWASENSRDALFDAMQRREAFGTSGPRIAPRFFGGWNYAADTCGQADMVEQGYADGVPMGSDLPPANGAEAPTFIVAASRDQTPLQRLQIIKGWISEHGESHYKVFHVAGDETGQANVDLETGALTGAGADNLCATFTDPEFDATQSAYYYLRVIENPTLRWSWAQCVALPEADRPAACENAAPKVIQEMAWTSPIWYKPEM